MFRLLVLPLALALATPAFASPAIELASKTSAAKQMSTTISTGAAAITPADFVATILDGAKYPKTASYMGVPALLDCKTLERRADGYTIVYQRTGGNSFLKSRQWVIAMKVTKQTETDATIEWTMVKHSFDGTTFTGPYASALQAHTDAVMTPYNHGSWKLNGAAKTITYTVESDPGGSVPGWLMSESAVMAFPRELLKVRWGITG